MTSNTVGWIIGGLVVLILILVLLPAFLGVGMMGFGMMGPFAVGWGLMALPMVLFWGGIIALIVLLVRGTTQPGGAGPAAPPSDSALEVLKRRYASGEIGKEEYEEKKRDLA